MGLVSIPLLLPRRQCLENGFVICKLGRSVVVLPECIKNLGLGARRDNEHTYMEIKTVKAERRRSVYVHMVTSCLLEVARIIRRGVVADD
jgi:hypothetical protein